jgi:hypothetical protein
MRFGLQKPALSPRHLNINPNGYPAYFPKTLHWVFHGVAMPFG